MKKLIIMASLLITCATLSGCVIDGRVGPGRGYYNGGGCYRCWH